MTEKAKHTDPKDKSKFTQGKKEQEKQKAAAPKRKGKK